MTFDQWWATLETREQQRADKEFTREAFEVGVTSRDAEIAELVGALSRLTQCAPATVECENMHHRKLDQHGYDKTCHLVSRYAEALYNAQELLAKVRKQ